MAAGGSPAPPRAANWPSCPPAHPCSPLLTPAGDAVWLPLTKLGTADQAWTTTDLETAIARQAQLRILPPGLVTVVRALPHE